MRKMKDSGIEWIGEIPEEWNIRRIKHIATLAGRIGWQGLTSDEYTDEGAFLITGVDFRNGRICWESCVHVPMSRWEEATQIQIKEGDLLITKDGTVGKVAIAENVPGETSLNSGVLLIRNIEECNTRFLFWMIQSEVFWKWFGIINAGNSTIIHLYQHSFDNFSFPYPEGTAQRNIALYLDSKCSKIDSIISKQEQIIEKLKEYKLSLITEAVTKGLDPNVEMKDSGICYIGDIANYMEVIKLKNIVEVSDGTHDTPLYVDNDTNTYPLVTSKCIVNGNIDITLANNISQKDYDEINRRSKVEKYDVLMPMIGTVGNPAIVLDEPRYAIKNLALIRTHGDYYLGKYVVYLLNSNIVLSQFEMLNRGGVQNFISQDKLRNLTVTIPNNIKEVVDYLDVKSDRINQRIDCIINYINRISSYKKSLIYEVVTGKKEV